MVTQKYVYESDEEYPVYSFTEVTVQVADDVPVVELPTLLVNALQGVRQIESDIMLAIQHHLRTTGQKVLEP